ncbi:serine hydrolase, partial [Streptomyces erythrochromogenes]
LWEALGMNDTHHGPLPLNALANCAPTEFDPTTGTRPRGTVHDFSARLLGPSCGSAGVFSTADDLGRFLRHLLGAPTDGSHPGVPRAWTHLSLQVQTGRLAPVRGLLWHLAPETLPDADIWAHYGFTGTGMWLCPRQGRWAVLLTNKVYYSRERQPISEIRNAFRALVFS